MKNNISIVYICDEKYVMPTCVSIQSIYENRKGSVYDIYIIGVDLSQKSKDKIKDINLPNINIHLLNFENKYKDLNTNHVYVSKAALFKFDIPNILPDLDKVLYLDGDTIVLDDLAELFNTDIKDYYAGVVRDFPAYYVRKDYEEVGLYDYFNSGVMLLNLNNLRNNKIPEKLLEYKLQSNSTRYMDQDCFNVIFSGHIKFLDPKYNYMTSSIDLYKKFCLKDEKPIIVHTTSGNKPWKFCTVLYADIWFNYFKNSVCHDFILHRKYINKEKLGNKRIIHLGKIKISYNKNKKDLLNKYYEKFMSNGYYVRRLKDKTIEIKGRNLIIRGKADNTFWTASDVLCDTCYDFSINEPYIMIDIGFNIGIASLYFARNKNIKNIYSFEPFKPTYDIGIKNLELNPELSKKIKLFDFGLGSSDKFLEIAYNPNLPGNMSTVFNKFNGGGTKEKVEIKNAYNILKDIIENHTEKIFIKLDTEGSEFEILPLLDSKGLLKRISVLILEYHRESPQLLVNILNKNGFVSFREEHQNSGLIKAVKL